MDMKFCSWCGEGLVPVQIDGKPRLSCASKTCEYVFWDNPTPVVAAITELDGNIVLARNKEWPEKVFGLITGFLERGETPDEGVLREVKEELGLEGRVESFVGYYSFPEMNQLILAFHIKAEGEILIGEELEEIKLIRPEKLRPWRFGTGLAIKDWLEARKAASIK
jgi:NAD+ diphosphatase